MLTEGLQVTSSANRDYRPITSITAQQRTPQSRNCCSTGNPESSCPHSCQFHGTKDNSQGKTSLMWHQTDTFTPLKSLVKIPASDTSHRHLGCRWFQGENISFPQLNLHHSAKHCKTLYGYQLWDFPLLSLATVNAPQLKEHVLSGLWHLPRSKPHSSHATWTLNVLSSGLHLDSPEEGANKFTLTEIGRASYHSWGASQTDCRVTLSVVEHPFMWGNSMDFCPVRTRQNFQKMAVRGSSEDLRSIWWKSSSIRLILRDCWWAQGL